MSKQGDHKGTVLAHHPGSVGAILDGDLAYLVLTGFDSKIDLRHWFDTPADRLSWSVPWVMCGDESTGFDAILKVRGSWSV